MKANKIIAGLVLGSVIATAANAYIRPTFKKGTTLGIQTKSVTFDSKLGLKDSTLYGLYYGVNFNLGAPAAWGVLLNFEFDYSNVKIKSGGSFNYTDYYASIAPSYTFVTGENSNIRVYAGGKFGYNGFENTTGYSYGYIFGSQYNYKRLNIGAEYYSGTTDISGLDYDISEVKGYIGYNF